MVERIVPLLSYLIKKIITTTTIATTTPSIPPAIGSMLLAWGSGGENCTNTILPDKDNKDGYHHYRHYYATNASCARINVTCLRLWWRERYVLLLSFLINMTRITTITIATTTPSIHPAIRSMLLVWGYGGENCNTTILPVKDTDHYHHYHHYYATNTSCYRSNVTCLRLWWKGLYHYYLTW